MNQEEKTPRYSTPDFRIYPVELVRDRHGRKVWMTLCEELVGGRWEPFYSIRPFRKEAANHE